MCTSCGCNQPNNRHGNPDNITAGDLKRAKKSGNRRSLKHTISTMTRTLKRRKG